MKVSIWNASKYTILGAPISLKLIKVPWSDLLTPKFPLLYSLLPFLFYIIVGSILEPWHIGNTPEYDYILARVIEGVPISILFYLMFFSWIPLLLNLLLLGWCFLILSIFKKLKNRNDQATQGAQRITYFSAFYEFLFFMLLTCLPGFLLNPHAKFTAGTALFVIIVGFAGIMRLGAVFQGMRHQTGGNILAGLLSILCCVDVWCFVYLCLA